MSKRFLVELASTPSVDSEWIDEQLLAGLSRGFSGVGIKVTELIQSEVIGNLADFTKATQEAAKTIPAPVIKVESTRDFDVEKQCAELSEALVDAINALDWLCTFTGSKKLKKLVRRLKTTYENYA